jgi:hypothetical protein
MVIEKRLTVLVSGIRDLSPIQWAIENLNNDECSYQWIYRLDLISNNSQVLYQLTWG